MRRERGMCGRDCGSLGRRRIEWVYSMEAYHGDGNKPTEPDVATTMQSLGIDKLTREQRINLVKEIWDSIDAEGQPSLLTESQRQELRRRVADDDANPDDVITWEQLTADLARLKP